MSTVMFKYSLRKGDGGGDAIAYRGYDEKQW